MHSSVLYKNMTSVNTPEKDPVTPTEKPKNSPLVQIAISLVRKAALPILLLTGAGITGGIVYNIVTKKMKPWKFSLK